MSRMRYGVKDYYATLGVGHDCSADEVRKAYRKLALEWHPDRNPERPESTERFREVSEAYGVLIDPVKRRQYDEAFTRGNGNGFGYSQEDVFRDLFANRGASAIFEEIARELERRGVRVDRHYFHTVLSGGTVITGGLFIIGSLTPVLGALKLARTALSGISHLGRSLLGKAAQSMLTPAAQEGVLPLPLTRAEAREGTEKSISVQLDGKQRRFLVRVPAGVSEGTRLRLRGRGKDVYLAVEIRE